MKKRLRNLALGLGIAVAGLGAYNGISNIYTKYREFPEVVGTKNIEGVPVKVIRTISKNPVLRTLDGLFENKNFLATNFINRNGDIQINLSDSEEFASEFKKNFESYKKNASLPNGDPNWSFSKQMIYNDFKGLSEEEISKKDFMDSFYHEDRHRKDIDIFNKVYVDHSDLETRAFLYSIIRGGPGHTFSSLDYVRDNCKNGPFASNIAFYSDSRGYCAASKKVFEEFESYPDSKTDYALAHLKKEELGKRALEIYKKLYPRYFNKMDFASEKDCKKIEN